MPDVRVVVFDCFGTLTVDQTPAERHRLQAPAAAALGVRLDEFLQILKDTFAERATGAWGSAEQALGEIAHRLGANPSQAALASATAIRREAEFELARPRPGVVDLLADLRAHRVPVGVLSDCTWDLVTVWDDLPYSSLVDAAVFSVETGVQKPHPAMYAEVARRLSADHSEVVYVGDGGSRELTGAKQAGMWPVLLRESLDEPAETRNMRYNAETEWDGDHVRDAGELRSFLASCGILPPGGPVR